jgi:predicted DNA-binding transcriptional regulator AlpA
MPSAPIRNTALPDLSREKSDDQSFPSSSPQFLARRPRPQKPVGVSQNGLSGDLEEVTFLRLPGVKAITGLSKTSLYALIREKSFPTPVRLGARTVAWVRSEVREWAIERVRASR